MRLAAQRVVQLLHAVDGPEQIDRRGPRARQRVADFARIEIGSAAWSTPSATPMAAATPIAGAPRITIVRMASATS